MPDAGRGQHLVGRDRRAVLHRRDEPGVGVALAAGDLEAVDEPLVDVEALLLAEPVGVVEEHPDRHRVVVGRAQAAVLEEGGEGVLAGGVEVPVRPGAQVHVGRHLLAPEAHRPADDRGVDAVVAGARGGRVGVRARSDDEQVRALRHGALRWSSLRRCSREGDPGARVPRRRPAARVGQTAGRGRRRRGAGAAGRGAGAARPGRVVRRHRGPGRRRAPARGPGHEHLRLERHVVAGLQLLRRPAGAAHGRGARAVGRRGDPAQAQRPRMPDRRVPRRPRRPRPPTTNGPRPTFSGETGA